MAGVGNGGWGLGGGGGGGDSVPEARPDVAHTPDTWCSEPRQTSSPPNSPPLAVSPFASLGGAGHTGLPRPQTPGAPGGVVGHRVRGSPGDPAGGKRRTGAQVLGLRPKPAPLSDHVITCGSRALGFPPGRSRPSLQPSPAAAARPDRGALRALCRSAAGPVSRLGRIGTGDPASPAPVCPSYSPCPLPASPPLASLPPSPPGSRGRKPPSLSEGGLGKCPVGMGGERTAVLSQLRCPAALTRLLAGGQLSRMALCHRERLSALG